MDLDWTTTAVDGVTLVHVHLHNDTATDRRIRLANRLDATVLPPRRHGVAETGWDDRGYETVVRAGERVAVGYACPAPSRDPPVELVADERALPDDESEDSGRTDPAEVVRRLGPAAPPRDALPTPDGATPSTTTPRSQDTDASDRTDGRVDVDAAEAADAADTTETTHITDHPATAHDPPIPDPVDDWFAAVERRVDRAEALTEPSVSAATEVLSDAGGLDAVDSLPAHVITDAAQLRAVADRAATLAARAESTDVSLSALRRLA